MCTRNLYLLLLLSNILIISYFVGRYWRIIRQYPLRRSVKTGVNNQYLLRLKIKAITPVYAPVQGQLTFRVFDENLSIVFSGCYDQNNYRECLQAIETLRKRLFKNPPVLPVEWLRYKGVQDSPAIFSISITR